MDNNNYKWLITTCFSMIILAWPYASDAATIDRTIHHSDHIGHHGADHHHRDMHSTRQNGNTYHDHEGNRGHYYHGGKHYNYYHNGSYYNYFYKGDYYLYFIKGVYYNYFYNGAYYRNCRKIPGYWSHGHWNRSTMRCR